jgi:hypothetical protein
VAAQALAMNRIVSADALRRAIERIDEVARTACMRPSLMHSVREALDLLEQRDQRYLLRLRQTASFMRLIAMAFGRTDWSPAGAQGCQIAYFSDRGRSFQSDRGR